MNNLFLAALAASLLSTLHAQQPATECHAAEANTQVKTEQAEHKTEPCKAHPQKQQKLSGGAVLLRAFIANHEPVVLVKLKYTSQAPFVREEGESTWALTVGEIVGGVHTDIPKGTKVLCEIPYSPEEKKIEPYIMMSLVHYQTITKVFDDENMIYLGGVPFYDVYGSCLSELIRSGFPIPEEWQKLNQIITSADS